MAPRELDLWYCHSPAPNNQIKLLAQPIALTTLAKYSGLFHDLYGSAKTNGKNASRTCPAIISYTLRGPSASAFRIILNWMLRSASLAAAGRSHQPEALGRCDSLGPLAVINFRSKSYTTLAQLRLTAKILRIPHLELMFLRRMQQHALEKPLVSQVELTRLLTCGDFELGSTAATVIVRALAERYVRAEQADESLRVSEIWGLITSQQHDFIQAVGKELRKWRTAQPLPELNAEAKAQNARSKIFAHRKVSSIPEDYSRKGGLAGLPTVISPLSSCSCICTCEDGQEPLELRSASGNEYDSPCCPSCCPVQRANRAFFKTGLGDDPFTGHFSDATDKVQNWRLHSAFATGRPRTPTQCPETPTKQTSKPFVQSTPRPTSTQPPRIDVSLANFIPPLVPSPAYLNLRSSPAAARPESKQVDLEPPSPKGVINFIVPPFSPISPCTVVRKTYDEKGNEKLEMVRTKASVEKARSRLEEGLNEYICCLVM